MNGSLKTVYHEVGGNFIAELCSFSQVLTATRLLNG
jgi:hypothetical protein